MGLLEPDLRPSGTLANTLLALAAAKAIGKAIVVLAMVAVVAAGAMRADGSTPAPPCPDTFIPGHRVAAGHLDACHGGGDALDPR